MVDIPEEVIELALFRQSLAGLAPYLPRHAEKLRAAKITDALSSVETQIQARVDTLMLREKGWEKLAIAGVVSRHHYGSTKSVHSNASRVAFDNAKPAINQEAKRRYAELKKTPRLLAALHDHLVHCQAGSDLPSKNGRPPLAGSSSADASLGVASDDDND